LVIPLIFKDDISLNNNSTWSLLVLHSNNWWDDKRYSIISLLCKYINI
jgi:hypothetical protein